MHPPAHPPTHQSISVVDSDTAPGRCKTLNFGGLQPVGGVGRLWGRYPHVITATTWAHRTHYALDSWWMIIRFILCKCRGTPLPPIPLRKHHARRGKRRSGGRCLAQARDAWVVRGPLQQRSLGLLPNHTDMGGGLKQNGAMSRITAPLSHCNRVTNMLTTTAVRQTTITGHVGGVCMLRHGRGTSPGG